MWRCNSFSPLASFSNNPKVLGHCSFARLRLAAIPYEEDQLPERRHDVTEDRGAMTLSRSFLLSQGFALVFIALIRPFPRRSSYSPPAPFRQPWIPRGVTRIPLVTFFRFKRLTRPIGWLITINDHHQVTIKSFPRTKKAHQPLTSQPSYLFEPIDPLRGASQTPFVVNYRQGDS